MDKQLAQFLCEMTIDDSTAITRFVGVHEAFCAWGSERSKVWLSRQLQTRYELATAGANILHVVGLRLINSGVYLLDIGTSWQIIDGRIYVYGPNRTAQARERYRERERYRSIPSDSPWPRSMHVAFARPAK